MSTAVITKARPLTDADAERLDAEGSLTILTPHNRSSWYATATVTRDPRRPDVLTVTSQFGGSGDRSSATDVLAALSDALVPDENGDRDVPTVPVFGTLLNLAVLTSETDPSAVIERATRALEAEFGADRASLRILNTRSKQAADIRVDVSTSNPDGSDTVRAVGILEAESSYLVPMPHTVSLHRSTDGGLIVGD